MSEVNVYQEYLEQGQMLMSAGNFDLALEYFKKAEKEDPNHLELYINMGIVLANKSQYDEAEKTFKKALYVDKKCGEAHFHMGCIAALKGDLAQGISSVETAIAQGYATGQAYYTLGMMFEEQGEVMIAVRNYNKALIVEPTRADIHLQKANLLLTEGRNEEAIVALDNMIANCPDYYEGYHLKCAALSELNKYAEAEAVLDMGLERFPEEVGFKLDKAKILIHQEKYKEAQVMLETLEKEDSGWKREILLEEVRIAGLQEDYAKTTELLEKAYRECRVDGNADEEITYLLMSIYMSAKKYDQVIPMTEEVIKISKNDSYVNVAHFYCAESYDRMGNAQKAKEMFEKTVDKCRATSLGNPAALDAYVIRALSLNRLGENEKALELADYVVALAPNSGEAHSAKAVILKAMGRKEEMEAEIKKINELGGQLSTIMSAL